MKNSRSGLFAVVVCVIVFLGFLVLLRPNVQSASAEESKVRTTEKKPGDVPEVAPLADPAGDADWDVLVTKESAQVYRVEVKATVEGRAAYAKEWVKFCGEHSTARWSPAPPDGKGNTGTTVVYWNVDE